MNSKDQRDITSLIRVVQRRQRFSHAVTWLAMACWWIGVVALMLSVVDRVGAEPWVPWSLVIVIFGVAALGIGVAGFLACHSDELDTARQVDGRLGLKDRLSSAVACRGNKDPFSMAVIDDAVKVAASSQTRESARRRFPVRPPAFWWASPLLFLLAVVVTMFGQWDLVSREGETQEVNLVEVRREASESLEATMDVIKQDPRLSEAMTESLDELDAETIASLESKEDEQAIRREALKRVTVLNQQLEEIIEGPEGQAMETIEDSLGDLETPGESSVKELVESLSKSDFDKASEAFSKLQEKIESGDMTAEERKQAASDLRKLSDQLDEMSADKQAMRDALRQAGLDPDLADDPQALKNAIEQADQLNESQKESLQEMADSKEQASKLLKDLAEASDQACKQCNSGGDKQGESAGKKSKSSGSSSRQGKETLDEMAKLKKMLDQAKSAQKSCESQCQKLGQGLAAQQACNKPGPGDRGVGDSAGVQETATNMVERNDAGEAVDGPVVSRTKVEQDQEVGESKMTLKQAQQAAREGFDEAMEENTLPRQYHDALKHYFADPDAVDEAVKSDADKDGSKPTQEQPDEPTKQGSGQEADKK